MSGLPRRFAALVVTAMLLAPLAAAAAPAAAPAEQRAYLTVKLNGKDQGPSLVILLERDAFILARDLDDANLVVPADAYRTIDGRRYVSLRSVDPNVAYTVDADALSIDVRLGTTSFGQTTLDGGGGASAALPVAYARSGFFNYAVAKDDRQGVTFSGEAVASIGHGVLDTYVQRSASHGFSMGQTAWTRDDIGRSERLVLGRSDVDINDFSGTGAAVSLDGIVFRRDLQLNPGVIRNYTTSLSGVASSASTVQLFVNGVLVREEQIGAGAFRVTNVPLRDGVNDTSVVIRDAFGHTQTISRPMYIGTDMYRRGEREFAFGLGRLAGFGVSRHGGIGVARYALGITDAVSAGARAQVSGDVWNTGSWLAAGTRYGQFSASLSASGARPAGFDTAGAIDAGADDPPPVIAAPPLLGSARAGGTAFGLSYNGAFRRIGIGASIVGQSPYYATASQSPLADRALRTERVYLSGGLAHTGTGITLSWSRAVNRDTGLQADQTLAVTQLLSRGVNASLSYGNRTVNGLSARSLGVRIDAVLRKHDRVTMSTDVEQGRTSRTIEFEHRPDAVIGTSYSAQLGSSGGAPGTSGSASAAFDVVGTTPVGTLELQHLAGGAYRDTTMSFSGAVAIAGGGVFFTRPILQSFAVVDAGGVAGLRALVNNQSVGVTDRSGRIVIADLFPYQRNDVSIDANSIPDGALLDTSTQSIAPGYRSGAVVKFAIRRIRAYTGRLVFDDDRTGSPSLGQVTLTLRSRTAVSDIGTDGTFYFDDLEAGTYEGRAEFKGGSCTITLAIPPSQGPLTELGVIACAKAAR